MKRRRLHVYICTYAPISPITLSTNSNTRANKWNIFLSYFCTWYRISITNYQNDAISFDKITHYFYYIDTTFGRFTTLSFLTESHSKVIFEVIKPWKYVSYWFFLLISAHDINIIPQMTEMDQFRVITSCTCTYSYFGEFYQIKNEAK